MASGRTKGRVVTGKHPWTENRAAKASGLAGLEGQRFRKQVLDAIDGLPLTDSDQECEDEPMSSVGLIDGSMRLRGLSVRLRRRLTGRR